MPRKYVRFPRRLGRQRQPFHWRRELNANQSVTAGSDLTVTVLSSTDYASNTLMSPSGVSLVRLRLAIAIEPEIGVAEASVQLWFAVFVVDTNQAAFGVTSGNMTDERMLAFDARSWIQPASGTAKQGFEIRPVHFDIRQRVKLRDSDVRLVVTNQAAVNAEVHVLSSCLVQGDVT